MTTPWVRAAIRLGLASASAVLLSACASASLAPPLPTPGLEAQLPSIGESAISVRTSASYSALGAAANAAVPASIFDISGASLGHGLTFRLTGRRSDILVSPAADRIEVATSVHVDGALDSRCVVLTHCVGTLTVDGRVWGTAKPTINPDWTLSLAPEAQFFINEAEVNAPLFPRAVSIKGPLTRVLQGPFNDLVGRLDAEVGTSTVLRSAAATAWSEMARPIPISTSPPVWLTIHPTRILTEQPAVTDHGVELGTALIAEPEIVIGDTPTVRDLGPLPDLTLVDRVPDQFSLYLPVRLSWDEATALAEQSLTGKSIQAGGGVSVLIDHVSIFNNGDEVGVKLVFHARAKSGGWKPAGTIYLVGKPVYNLGDGYIAIENLHFDVKTQDAILRLAAWLAHKAMIDDLQTRLHFDVRAKVQARRQDLERTINNTRLGSRITLVGEISTLAPSAVYLTREALQVNVVALGTLKVIVQ